MKKSPFTTNSTIRQSLRRLWLRSRERSSALKRDGYTCQKCGRKQSKAKGKEFSVEVHHKKGILNWESLFKFIRTSLLCNPDHLETLCKDCHEKV